MISLETDMILKYNFWILEIGSWFLKPNYFYSAEVN